MQGKTGKARIPFVYVCISQAFLLLLLRWKFHASALVAQRFFLTLS